jgi:hypothetical protein
MTLTGILAANWMTPTIAFGITWKYSSGRCIPPIAGNLWLRGKGLSNPIFLMIAADVVDLKESLPRLMFPAEESIHHMETAKPSPLQSPATTTPVPRPEAIIVPRRHGAILIEPPAPQLAAFLDRTALFHGDKSGDQNIQLPIAALTKLARGELINAMARFAGETGFAPPADDAIARQWVITGHQVEFYHPGVWSKVILTDALAKKSHAMAIDLLVDHDTVDRMGMVVPHFNGPHLEKASVTWTDASALPAEFLSSPQGEEKARWLNALKQFPLTQTDSMRQFTDLLASDTDSHYVSWMSRARRTFEQSFGVAVRHVPCGYLCSGVAWHSFLLAWLANAHTWCSTYNAALHDYRLREGISNPGRPMPDLAITDTDMELPFWIYSAGQPRQRLIVRHDRGPHLLCGSTHISISDLLNGDWIAGGEHLRQRLAAAGLRVRPRALTLTMFVRLLLSDLFIHGIGGALYDQMTDQIMLQLFGQRGAYACASAGWLLPLAAEYAQSRRAGTDIPELQWLRHHVRGNPELLHSQEPLSGPAAELSQQRGELIARIARQLADDRQQPHRRGPHWQQRRDDFQTLHQINMQLLTQFAAPYQQLDVQIAQAQRNADNFAVAAWREYSLTLHPRSSLQTLIDTIRASV